MQRSRHSKSRLRMHELKRKPNEKLVPAWASSSPYSESYDKGFSYVQKEIGNRYELIYYRPGIVVYRLRMNGAQPIIRFAEPSYLFPKFTHDGHIPTDHVVVGDMNRKKSDVKSLARADRILQTKLYELEPYPKMIYWASNMGISTIILSPLPRSDKTYKEFQKAGYSRVTNLNFPFIIYERVTKGLRVPEELGRKDWLQNILNEFKWSGNNFSQDDILSQVDSKLEKTSHTLQEQIDGLDASNKEQFGALQETMKEHHSETNDYFEKILNKLEKDP